MTMMDPRWYRRRLERERYYTQGINLSSTTSSSTISSPSPPLGSAASTAASVAGLNMSTTAAGNKLAKEIHDEFLTCKICLEGFKTPKCLDCLHTFCEQCIDNHVLSECTYKKYSDYREFTCPLCRKRTQLPIGGVKKLPDNFLVSSLGEVVARQKPSKFPFCDICKLINRKHREATSKCIDCNKLMCKPCVDMHKDTKVTQLHSIFDVEIEKDIECKEHQDEVVRFYCEPCEMCICVLCTFNEHKDHEITQFSDAVSKYKDNIKGLLSTCKGKIDIYDKQIALICKCEEVVKGSEQSIRDTAIQFIAEIRNREKTLIDELHGFYGKELMEYVSRKNEMQNNLEGLKSTCNLTELVLKGKDIELLLLKRQVQEKLTTMAKVELKDLPRTIGKQISFVTGSLELGKLEDADSPVEKQKDEQITTTKSESQDQKRLTLPNMVFGRTEKNRDSVEGGNEDKPVSLPKRTVETQTDSQLEKSQGSPRMVNRAIQVEYPDGRYRRDESTPSSMQNRATGTDIVSTVEKAVNTKSRGLQPMATIPDQAGSSSQTEDYNTPSVHDEHDSNSLEPLDSPGLQRRRRRRERVKPMEVSVRPTTSGADSSEGSSSPVERRPVYSRYSNLKPYVPRMKGISSI